MQLSPNFTLAEMTRSQTALRKGIDNTPSPAQIENLRTLCEEVLEPVRAHFGRPVIISSGYRGVKLNRAIGGSATSQHCFGEAADFRVSGVRNIDVAQWMLRSLNYDQLIYEFGEAGWIHASYRKGRLRNAELTARRVDGRVVYLPGLLP